MRETVYTIESNKCLTQSTWELKLSGDTVNLRAGQFVEIKIDGYYLRRPFGVADVNDNVLTVLYRVAGLGTEAMTHWDVGEKINALIDLGNGFNTAKSGENTVLLGGGMGIAPLYYLAKTLHNQGKNVTAILGFKNSLEAFYIENFNSFANVIIATDDGSLGYHDNVVSLYKKQKNDFIFYYACGPQGMLKNLIQYSDKGEISLEARMGCGFGACMGCSIVTTYGVKRICKDGPVFNAAEVTL